MGRIEVPIALPVAMKQSRSLRFEAKWNLALGPAIVAAFWKSKGFDPGARREPLLSKVSELEVGQ